MSDKYLKVIEVLGEAIINKEIKESVLEYEIKSLKDKLKKIEDFCEMKCEEVNIRKRK